MAISMKHHTFSTLLLVVVVGLLIGSFFNALLGLIPGDNVAISFFTKCITFGVGDFVNNKPVLIDLAAIRFQVGFQFEFSLLSVLGVFLSLYFFRWYE